MRHLKSILPILLLVFALQSCNLFSAVGLGSMGLPVKEVNGSLSNGSNSQTTIDHSMWDALLKKYVAENGLVDYKAFQKDKPKLQAYLDGLSNQIPTEAWSVQELLAYYINIYNAATVKLILDNYPIESIKDISGTWTKAIVLIGDTKISLGGIEHGILRKMNEPRIHFAINCASFSCPKLQNEAFVASKIDAQLDLAAREFINSDKNDINASSPKLSSIFDWFAKDFIVNGKKDVIGYINRYSEIKIEEKASIAFKKYDWRLNEQ